MTMIFLYALPVLSGFSNYLWPLLLGARDMAFPRLNALSYWIYLAAGIFLYAELPVGRRRRTTAGSTTSPTPTAVTTPARTSTSMRSAWSSSASRPRVGAANFIVTRLAHARARACRSTGCRSWSGAR